MDGDPVRCAAQVPYRLLKSFHKIQQRLVRELEKKFSGKDVIIIANRRILAPTTSGQSNARPRSRTLTAVHEETLLDLCYPTGASRAHDAVLPVEHSMQV
jgi:small subunit ribosomal protein S7e